MTGTANLSDADWFRLMEKEVPCGEATMEYRA